MISSTDTDDPYLILCKLNNKTIYLKVDEHKNVLGTETKEEASHFYMKCSENKTRSADFHIVHYDNKPYYLSTNCNIFGCCKGPLNVTKNLEQAQFFCIHSEDRCLCPCNRLDNWNSLIEVPMCIFCSHHNFCMINGYISIKKIDSPTSYNTSVVVGRRKDECGALFQLENIAVQSKHLLKSNISATSNSAIELQIEGSIKKIPDTRDETSLKQSLDSKSSDHDEPSLRDQKPLPDIPSEHGPLTDTQTKKENPPFPGTLGEQPRLLPDTPDDQYTLYRYEWAPLTSAPSEQPLLPDDPRNSSEIFPLKDTPSEQPLLPDNPKEHSQVNAETMIEMLPPKDTPSEEPLLPHVPDDPREHSRTNAETMIPPKDAPSGEPLLPGNPKEHSQVNAETITMIEMLPPKDTPSEEPLLPDDPDDQSLLYRYVPWPSLPSAPCEQLPHKDAPMKQSPQSVIDVPSGQSLQSDANVSEGWLYKRGKIVLNWKLRWFVLDTDRKEVITMH